MKLDNLNHWLTLLANVGVLVGIIVVAVELQQTQIEMRAETSTLRAEMARQNDITALELGMSELTQKIVGGEDLTLPERSRATAFFRNLFRYYENLHYQNQLGVLDVEIWEANLNTIRNICTRNPAYTYMYPDGLSGTLRASFLEFLEEICGS